MSSCGTRVSRCGCRSMTPPPIKNGLRRRGHDQHVAQLRERPRHGLPHRVVRGDLVEAPAIETSPDRAARGQTLDASSVKGACARPVITWPARDTHVTELGMAVAVHRRAIGDESDADARADGHIGQVGQRLPCAPAQFRERGSVHVRVEFRRNAEALLQPARHVGAGPALLGRGRDEAPGRRCAIEVDRAEAGDPQRADRFVRVPFGQDAFDLADGLLGLGRVDDLLVENLLMRTRENANAFRAAKLDAGVQGTCSCLSALRSAALRNIAR